SATPAAPAKPATGVKPASKPKAPKRAPVSGGARGRAPAHAQASAPAKAPARAKAPAPAGAAQRGSPEARELAANLDGAIGYRFRDPDLLLRALTHPSFSYETTPAGRTAGMAPHYESVEFLGDAVLGLLVAEEIFRRFPERDEGEMSRLR